jgi:acyl carrier protein
VQAAHDAIRQVAVIARDDAPGGTRLVAYVVLVPGRTLSPSELRGIAAATLPEYMVPAAFVVLDALPLSRHGKIDRRALPAPGWSSSESPDPVVQRGESPSTHEQQLASIWTSLLGVDGVGTRDSFFELGGHSLLLIQLAARVRQAFQVDLPLRTFFEIPTIAGLAAAIEQARTHAST